jgi:hypothetical protein
MKAQWLVLVVVVLAGVVGLLYALAEPGGSGAAVAGTSPAAGAAPSQGAATPPTAAGLAQPDAGGLEEPVRSARRDAAQAPPAGAEWLRGRIVFPEGTPDDERLTVRVRDGESAEVGPDGSFRLAVAEGASTLALELDARYLYLEQAYELTWPSSEPARLEPVLGAHLLVRVLPPAGHDATELSEARMTLGAFRDTTAREQRHAPASAEGEFVFPALRADLLYTATLSDQPFADVTREGVRVFAGRASELELELRVGAEVTGVVRGPDGAPLADARVSVHTRSPIPEVVRWSNRRGTTTDDAGHFRIRGATPGPVRVTASAADLDDTRLELGELADGEQRADVELRLGAGDRLAGRVQWPDGSPADGASVRGVPMGNPWVRGAEASSDGEGRFELSGLDGGPYIVFARAEHPRGEGPQWWRARKDGVVGGSSALVLVLEEGDRVVGSVRDDLGVPPERFTIRARPLDDALSRRSRGELRETFKRSEGVFELEGLAAGAWDVRAEARGHASSGWRRVQMPEGGGALHFIVSRLALVRGSVTDAGGDALADARVKAGAGDETDKAKTDAAGEFELTEVVPGRVELVAESEGARASAPLELTLAPGEERDGLVLVVRTGARIEGRVDPSIEDFAARKVLASPADEFQFVTTLCDEDGHFAYEGLEPGRWRVSFDWRSSGGGGEDWVAGYQRRAEELIELAEGETTFVTLGRPATGVVSVHGVVTDQGAPCAEYLMYILSTEDPELQPINIGRTGADGSYELTVPAPGEYRFTVGRDQRAQVPFARAVPAGTDHRLDLELPSGSVAGALLKKDGSPAAGQSIMLRVDGSPATSRSFGTAFFGATDADGRFVFERVPAGHYHLRTGGWGMPLNGLGIRVVHEVTLAEGQHLTDLSIELEQDAVLEGGVLDVDGRPAPGVLLQVFDAGGQELFVLSEVRTDYSGSFRLPGIGAGEVTVRAEGADGARAELRVRVGAGEVASVVLTLEQ